MIKFTFNTEKITAFPHYWEVCVGSSEAYTALREDYREQLKRAHNELGFKYVRFHGIFDDRMSVLLMKKEHSGKELGLVYNFANIDNIFDYLLEIGMKPFVELGFMPSAIASGDQTVFHCKSNVTPPKAYEQWEELIGRFVEHLIDRYGIEEVKSWFFEVWNEPNLFFFFGGSKEEYFKLYEVSARTIKAIHPELRVGGPATSCNAWIKDTVEALATKTESGYRVIVYNHNIPEEPIREETISLDLSVLTDKKTAVIYRIDESHANPKKMWQELGEPQYLKKNDVVKLHQASELVANKVKFDSELVLTIPAHGVIAIDI